MNKHYDHDAWHLYIEGQLTSDIASSMEQHLYKCPICLDLYMTSVEQLSNRLPAPVDPTALTDAIMEQISTHRHLNPSHTTISERRRTIRNYFIAAAATLVLMVTGIFQGLLYQVDAIQQPSSAEGSGRVSDKLVEHTLRFLEIPPSVPSQNQMNTTNSK
ncbi:anti-sigma factor family protein [Paenibacillus sp. KN14-4R]|uniref:anti-sigma factor family protein n=1 Tax=Paenibacillus sp. KN14-4R TaxID=3445773 RepID=UPI003F9FE073